MQEGTEDDFNVGHFDLLMREADNTPAPERPSRSRRLCLPTGLNMREGAEVASSCQELIAGSGLLWSTAGRIFFREHSSLTLCSLQNIKYFACTWSRQAYRNN